MPNESGTWIMYGCSWEDEECLHSVEEAIEYIEKVGFLPLFKNDIPGFSIEERTVPDYWWSENARLDPWQWREEIARSGRVAYGKFFGKKAGFVSREWIAAFANVRRDGYDFDALWEDGKASLRQKKIMDIFLEGGPDTEVYSNDLKLKAGFGKGGEKNFEGVLASLQMQTYLIPVDFRQRVNKKGEAYGWPIAVYAMPEHVFGYETFSEGYKETPADAYARIVAHMKDIYPIATAKQIERLIR